MDFYIGPRWQLRGQPVYAYRRVAVPAPRQRTTTGETSSLNRGFVPMVPTACGKYTLMAKIGHGGMAEVYVAVATGIAGFQKLAVVKRIHPQLLEDAEFTHMFMDEARLAARLSHPNVVETYDVGEHDGIPFIAMEYMEGAPLDRIVKAVQRREERFDVPLAASLMIEVLRGLHYAHEVKDYSGKAIGVVHRDISPSNVFLTYQGEVKVIDFGIAKASTKLAETRTGQIKGKLSYMAPEQARGRGVDRRSDIWAVGVMLYEMCVGERLFKRDSEIETLQELLAADIDQLLEPGQGVIPPPVLEVIRKSLQRDLNARWATAEEMSTELRKALDGLGIRPADLGGYASELLKGRVDAQRAAVADLLRQVESSGRVDVTAPASSDHPMAPTRTEVPQPSAPAPAAPAPRRRSSVARSGMAAAILVLAVAVGGLAAITTSEKRDDLPAEATPAGTVEPPPPPSAAEPPGSSGAVAPAAETRQPDGESTAREDEEREQLDPALPISGSRATARRRRPTQRVQRDVRPAETAMESQPEEPPAEPTGAPGYLTLVTTPWSEVFIGNRSLGTTPLARVQVPSGTHTFRLRNPEEGIDTFMQLTIPTGGTVTRRLGLR